LFTQVTGTFPGVVLGGVVVGGVVGGGVFGGGIFGGIGGMGIIGIFPPDMPGCIIMRWA
jgi:hypothetical protein